MSNKNKNKLVQVTYTRPVRKLGIGDWKMGGQTLNDAFKGEGASWMGEAGNALGSMIGSGISNGLESGAGNAIGALGNIASNIPGPWGAAVSGGLQVVGGLTNAAFGSKLNQENIDHVKDVTAQLNATTSNLGDYDALVNNMNNGPTAFSFDKNYIGKDGWFSNKAKNEYKKLKEQMELAAARQQLSYNVNADQIAQNTRNNLQRNYIAYGGPLFAEGGSIHINPKNKGKFTAAAKKAGMGVQEYASHVLANKDKYSSTLVKRANFARNAAHWHDDGGFLNQYNLFAGGGDMNENTSTIQHETWYDYDYDNAVEYYNQQYGVTGEQLENLVKIKERLDKTNWTTAAKKATLQTMYRESSFRPEIVNSLGYRGLLQWGGEGRSPKDWKPTVDYQIDYFLRTMDSEFMPAYVPDKKITKSSQVAEMFRTAEDPELAMYLLAASHQRNGVNKKIATKQGISMARTGAWNNTDFEYNDNTVKDYYTDLSYNNYLRTVASNEGTQEELKVDNAEEAYQRMANDPSYNYRDYFDNTPSDQLVYDARDHWPDTYKTAYHPTFSEESKYSGFENDLNPLGLTGGTWNGNTFIPSQDQMLSPDAFFYMQQKPIWDWENYAPERVRESIDPTLIGTEDLYGIEELLPQEEFVRPSYIADPDALCVAPPLTDIVLPQPATGSSWGQALERAGISALMNTPEYRFSSNFQKFGGELNTNGADFTNGLLSIDNGGTHEENPLQGIPMGTDNEGTPNLVEEGETIYNDYVFSNRFEVPKELKERYHLSKKKKVSFADASKKLAKESEERPNDPISKRGLNALMNELIAAQEYVKEQKEMERRAQEQKQLLAQRGMGYGGNLYSNGSWLQEAPLWGMGMATLTDALGLTNKADYTNAKTIENITRGSSGYTPVSYNPSGSHATYIPLDTRYGLNQLQANSNATRRALLQNAGLSGGRSSGMAAILAADHNANTQYGNMYRQAAESNIVQRQQVLGINNQLDLANAQAAMQAAQANQTAEQTAKERTLKGIQTAARLRENITRYADSNKSNNYSNFLTALGDYGKYRQSSKWRDEYMEGIQALQEAQRNSINASTNYVRALTSRYSPSLQFGLTHLNGYSTPDIFSPNYFNR